MVCYCDFFQSNVSFQAINVTYMANFSSDTFTTLEEQVKIYFNRLIIELVVRSI